MDTVLTAIAVASGLAHPASVAAATARCADVSRPTEAPAGLARERGSDGREPDHPKEPDHEAPHLCRVCLMSVVHRPCSRHSTTSTAAMSPDQIGSAA